MGQIPVGSGFALWAMGNDGEIMFRASMIRLIQERLLWLPPKGCVRSLGVRRKMRRETEGPALFHGKQ